MAKLPRGHMRNYNRYEYGHSQGFEKYRIYKFSEFDKSPYYILFIWTQTLNLAVYSVTVKIISSLSTAGLLKSKAVILECYTPMYLLNDML